MNHEIEITRLSLGAVLAALWNGTGPLGLGILHSSPGDTMTKEEGQNVINTLKAAQLPDDPAPSFILRTDYILGRPLKVGFRSDEDKTFVCRTDLYDRDAGQGKAALVIGNLRATFNKEKEGIV